ncbi:MAG: helix-turn-helix transcriptional regulator [Pseudomonadota bacterium]
MAKFSHKGSKSDFYHYLDSGLDDIWLSGSGVVRTETPYGPATSIHNIDELHNAIGRSIANSKEINRKEFRFLRVELDLSQKALASLLRATEQQVYRWETGQTAIPGTAQALLAGYYLETLDPESRAKEMLETISELDATITELEGRIFMLENDEWSPSQVA